MQRKTNKVLQNYNKKGNMRIGVVAPFNPFFIKEYLSSEEIPDINNAATAVNTLVLSLLQCGHDLKIFTSSVDACKITKLVGNRVEVWIVPYSIFPRWMRLGRFMAQLYMPQCLRRVIKSEVDTMDVLHAHWTYEYAMAAHYFSRVLPVYVTVRDWAPYIRSLQVKMIEKLIWKQKYDTFRKVMADEKITFIANSQYTYDRIMCDYPEKFVSIIPNSIKNENIIKEKKRKDVRYKFISISQNIGDPRKNFISMLKAFQMYKKDFPMAELHLIGFYDKQSDYYSKWRSENLLKSVVFYGRLPYNEVLNLMDEMSCLIHPSLEETFGNILLEAMARCVPCIGGEQSGAVPQVLGNGEYGVLCNVHEPQSIYEAMCKLTDWDLADRYAHKATEMLIRTYSSEIIAKKHVELFQSGLSAKKKRF